MTGTKLTLSVAAGVVVGGCALFGIMGLLVAHPWRESPEQTERRHEYRQFEMKMIGLAAIQYGEDSDDVFPPLANVRSAIKPYLLKQNLGREEAAVLGALDRMDWKILAAVPQTSFDDAGRTEMAFLADKDGRAVVYADGRATWLSAK